MAATSNISSTPSAHVASQDVGLIFVREYYTFLNKKPHRLHAFYNKDSLFVRGDEGSVTTTVKGQEEIRKKIEECKFEDCKVLVTQVDSQISANNGILIQVLGEMCNQNGPSQKFSQTFFLATQPNGYFVLNDIFRFLKDEVEIDYYTSDHEEVVETNVLPPARPTETVVIDITPSPVISPAVIPEKTEPVKEEKKVEEKKVEEKKVEEKKAEEKKVEEKKAEEKKKSEEEVKREHVKKWNEDVKKEQGKKLTAETPVVTEEVKKAEPVPVKEETPDVVNDEKKKAKPSSENKQPQQQKKEQQQQQQQKREVKENKPSAPKTWANLTASAPSPSPAPAAPTVASSVTSEKTPASPVVNNEKPQTQTPQPQQQQQQQQPQQQHNNKAQGPRKEATNIFVKLVNEAINEDQLIEAFTKIGSVKTCSISRPRNCAFIEFYSPESCQKALAQHRVSVGGNHTVLAEERRFTNQNNNNNNRYNNNNNQGRTQNNNQTYERRNNNNSNNNNRRGGANSGAGQTRTNNNNTNQGSKGRGAPNNNTTQK